MTALRAVYRSRIQERQSVATRDVTNDPDLRRIKGREDPEWFCREVLGVTPYDRQIDIIRAVQRSEQTSVNGANGVGKDWMIGRVIAWWQETRRPAKTIVMGPTSRQVKEIVWRELRASYNQARYPLGGRMLPTAALWDGGDDHFAIGFSTDKPWNITGFHSPNLLVVITEAHNFEEEAFVAAKRLHPTRLLYSGNPFSESGEFYDSHHEKADQFEALTITAYDTPNVQAGEELVPGLVTSQEIARLANDWGEDSPLFRATVNAEFAGRVDGLIKLLWANAAEQRTLDDGSDVDAGLDVAGPGEDETVLTIRQRRKILRMLSWRIDDPRGEVIAALAPYRERLRNLNVDSNGLGWGMYLHLRDSFPEASVNPVNVGEAATDSEKFANWKAELYWGLRERFEAGDVLGLLDRTAKSELVSIRYKHNARGQVIIESKEDMRKRGVKSPDRAESIMLAFAEPFRRWTSI